MKELDMLLERFLASEYDKLDGAGRADLLVLLEQEDPILWNWLLGHSQPYDVGLGELVGRIREYRVPGAAAVLVADGPTERHGLPSGKMVIPPGTRK
jgi:antitoxin CptB